MYLLLRILKKEDLCLKKLTSQKETVQKSYVKKCVDLIDILNKTILSNRFLILHRKNDKAFKRKRILTFSTLIYYMVNLIKGSYQDELDHYFKAIKNTVYFERVVSKAAYSKARKKLRYEAFIELNDQITHEFYDKFEPLDWEGFNLLAIDGSTGRLPNTEEILDHFGSWKSNNGKLIPAARLSQMFNVLNKVTIDATISPISIGERNLTIKHFEKLKENDLILMDRGYTAYWVYNLILFKKGNFCIRCPFTLSYVKKFLKSGKREKIIFLKPKGKNLKECKRLGLETETLELRLVRVELKTGETEVLITSLIDTEKYPIEIFGELYHKRWPVEEDYKRMKCRIEVENFTGKSVLSVYQDFHARVFTKNLTFMLAHPIRNEIEIKNQHKKYNYQLNFTQALSKVKDTIILLFNQPREIVSKLIESLHKIFIETTEPIRPGRKFPRKHKIRPRRFYNSYKSIR